MSTVDRADGWKDPDRPSTGAHPAGEIDLSGAGNARRNPETLLLTCDLFTVYHCGPTAWVGGPINLCHA